MPKEKHYAIEIHIIEEYSACVLVKASSAKKAKELLNKEYQEKNYIYEKVTRCPDNVRTFFKHAYSVPEEKVPEAYTCCIRSETTK